MNLVYFSQMMNMVALPLTNNLIRNPIITLTLTRWSSAETGTVARYTPMKAVDVLDSCVEYEFLSTWRAHFSPR